MVNDKDKVGPHGELPGFEENHSLMPYVSLGILVLIGIVGGALYFNGVEENSRPAVTQTQK